MNRFKRALTLVLALCMVLSCATFASAATKSPDSGKVTYTTKKDSISGSFKTTVKKTTSKKKVVVKQLNFKSKSGAKVYYKKISGCGHIKVSKTGKVTISKKFYLHYNKSHRIHKLVIKAYTKGKTNKTKKIKWTAVKGKKFTCYVYAK